MKVEEVIRDGHLILGADVTVVHLLLIIINIIKRLTETDNPKKSHRIILWL